MQTSSLTTAATSDVPTDTAPERPGARDGRTAPRSAPFDLLTTLAADPEMTAVFSEDATIAGWLRTEVALAAAQAELGDVPAETADAIAAVAAVEGVDRTRLWADSRVVGYPILPLVRQVDALLPPEHRGKLHLGATTQDIMDTGLALQLVRATDHLTSLLVRLGELLQAQAHTHAATVMAGRTHAQQAVPTTWGAKVAVYLSDVAHHLVHLRRLREEVGVVSLFGAGGTSAAYGAQAGRLRALVAQRLSLATSDVPWHVSRVRLAEWGQACALVCATTARLAREVIDLSRNEIAELSERSGHHRGASSTMPQKANPITSELLVGNAAVAAGLAAGLARIVEAGHERAAGEWQAEWYLLPNLAGFAASSVSSAVDLVDGLEVDEDAMRANLDVDHGLVMSEAYMMALAPTVGRERAHDLVYRAAVRARTADVPLRDALVHELPAELAETLRDIGPADYLGAPHATVAAAAETWARARRAAEPDGRARA